MFGRLLDSIRRQLALKILLALTVGAGIVMGVVISLAITNQRTQMRERMTTFGAELKSLAYAGIKHPMAVGDSPSIEKQLLDIRDELQDTEIALCDFNGRIVFATHGPLIGEDVSQLIAGPQTRQALESMLATGTETASSFEEKTHGQRYLVTMHSIRNEEECHHCHGTSRLILGGLLTRQSTDATYAAIGLLRNRTILISVVGIGALVAIIYLLLARLVTRPVTELATKAEELAAGNLEAAVPVHSPDAVGVLAASFNAMVHSIKDQIEYASGLRSAIADPLFVVDTDMVITFMNEACAELTGYTWEEVEREKLTCREVFQSAICDTDCPLRQCFASGQAVKGVRTTITRRDGREIPIMTSASALKDARGRVIGAVEICKDISVVLEAERLRYAQKNAEREEEQRRYLEGRADTLLATLSQVSDGNLTVRAELAGTGEVMDKIASHANHMLDNLEEMYDKISSFSRELEVEVARRTMMLRERTLLLERANRELRELDRLKSSFLANMSHELRTPMNSIIGYTDLLLDRIDGEINEEQEKSLQKVNNNAKHLLQLINDILDMSKIESGRIELAIAETDLKELVASVVATLQPALDGKGLFLEYDFAENLPTVFVDDDKARQIFNNLLSNAIKFTKRGGITIHARPSLQGASPGEAPLFVEVTVEDTGIGIRKEDIGKLFDKFSQLDVSTSRQYEGTGLGLSIARGLIVLHKGMIWAESEFGAGTRFTFTLPAQKKVMEKPAEPLVEPVMAEKLAEYFDKPAELFLQPPRYGGKQVKCWEYMHCGQTSCPAYGSTERRCWLIAGTHCKGIEVAKCPEKAAFCKGCEIIENLILEDQPALQKTGSTPAAGRIFKKTVLAIDDNPEVIELISKNIGAEYRVVGLSSGLEAVAEAKKIRPAVITLDIMMPGKDGWQVLQELKKDRDTRDIPVIILSIVDRRKMGFSLGATEYMVKPVDRETLLRKLRNLEKISHIQRILVVDHEVASVAALRGVLTEAGYRVSSAYSRQEAVTEIENSKPDLIVLNLIMPEESGFEVIEYIKTADEIREVPLILITRQDLSAEDIDALNGRIQGILNKAGMSQTDLLQALKSTIEKL